MYAQTISGKAATTLLSLIDLPAAALLEKVTEAAFAQPDAFIKLFTAFDRDAEWQRHARNGERINAIKAYREAYKTNFPAPGLKEAKDAVEDWCLTHGITGRPLFAPSY